MPRKAEARGSTQRDNRVRARHGQIHVLWQKFCDIWPAGNQSFFSETAGTSSDRARMLFNSFDFIFLFLPVTLAAFAAAVRLGSPSVAVLVLLVASYVFYGYGDHFAILLLAGSTAFNYVAGRAIAEAMRHGRRTLGRLLLGIGVCGDLALLGYFKYAGFLMTNLDLLAGAQWPIPVIALPIGISFYTFTQIAFLVDAFRGAAATLRATDYFLFVAYFPHLVAGPIIHHAQTIPQFRRMERDTWDASDVAVGLSILTIGLFKKLVIADSVAPFADGPARRYVNLMTTMLLGGFWHGAGWTFVIWGGLHGLYLIYNHLLRTARPVRSPRSPAWVSWLKRVAVFFAVTIAWVFFRADSIATAFAMLGGMSGIHGFGTTDAVTLSWLAACFIVVWALPNTYQIFARFRPTLPVRSEIAGAEPRLLAWRPHALGAVTSGVVFACCVLTINKFSPFLYFRF
jgi:D-alanyl-lipoteichoic acid acyltransferase DltB (MBOAT superfamily)